MVEAEDLRLQSDYTYTFFASLALIVYDVFLTHETEIGLIWRRRFSGVTILYFLNRYLYILSNVLSIAQLWSERSRESCLSYLYVNNIVQIAMLLSNTAFFSLRIWAVWSKRWLPFLVVLMVSLVPAWLNIYRLSAVRYVGVSTLRAPFGGCQFRGLAPELEKRLAASTRACTILCDSIVLVLTWAKTLEVRRAATQKGIRTDLTTLLNRDGTIYFGTLLVLNITAVVLDNYSVNYNASMILLNALTSILISRFILNLRHLAYENQYRDGYDSDDDDDDDEEYGNSGVISTLLGNVGAPLSQGTISDFTWSISSSSENLLTDPLSIGLYDEISDESYHDDV